MLCLLYVLANLLNSSFFTIKFVNLSGELFKLFLYIMTSLGVRIIFKCAWLGTPDLLFPICIGDYVDSI